MARRGVALVPVVAYGLIAGGVVVGGLWWWAVLRLVFVPGQSGLVEGAVAAGGWGLSLLPVHVTASRRGGGDSGARGARAGGVGGVTRASRRRRSDGVSGPL